MSQETFNQPYVGLIVDYYSSNNKRLAAIITEINSSSLSFRPTVTLVVFDPKEPQPETYQDVEPVTDDNDDTEPDLTGKWGFAHEYNLIQNESTIEYKGTETNEFVGTIPNPANIS